MCWGASLNSLAECGSKPARNDFSRGNHRTQTRLVMGPTGPTTEGRQRISTL